MREFLDDQSNIIEHLLHSHGIRGRVTGGSLSPRLLHFQIKLPNRVKPSQVAPLLPEIAEALEVRAVRLAPDPETGDTILEVPRPDPVAVRLLPLAKKVAEVVPPITATLGLDIAGTPLLLRLDAPEVAPTLITGSPSSGKSGLLQTMAISLALHNSPDTLRMLLIDLSGARRRGRQGITAWTGAEALPHLVAEPVRDLDEAHLRLRWAMRLLRERAEMLADGEPSEGPALVVMLDGLEEVAGESLDLLPMLARDGRGLGIQLVAAVQPSPVVEQIAWGARIVGRCKDAAHARAASGMQGIGADGLLGEGDFLAVLGGDALRFQAAALRPDELARTVQWLVRAAETEAASAEMELKAQRPSAAGVRLSLRQAGAHPRPL
ncbi:MAG: DNA translocase FtsK [Chloroflexia bacterium]